MYKHPLYPNLFSPLKINNMVLKNRIFAAPVECYFDKAKSGVAVMMRGSKGNLNSPRAREQNFKKYIFANPAQIAKQKEELLVLKRAGAKTEIEVLHCGMFADDEEFKYVIGPCDGVNPKNGLPIRKMDIKMMEEVCDQYAEFCRDAKACGWDMVMLHFAHRWLPSQFLSPGINKREDEFGGSFENRIRFPLMILKAVRKAVGPDYPIDMRISAYENWDGAIKFDEVKQFIKIAADEKLIDCVNVSFGHMPDTNSGVIPNIYQGHCTNVNYSKEIKELVNIPVIVVGSIMTPEEAEDIIASGKADAVVVGRAGIADPYWAKKAFECRSDDIIPCIKCGKCDLNCSVQLRTYHEHMVPLNLEKCDTPKKVVVVGGGPAGMKAALTAKEKGHDVILYEKSNELGGLLNCANKDHYKIDLRRFKEYLIHQVDKAKIKVVLNTEVNREILEKEEPDQVVLALGAHPYIPNIVGINKAHVLNCIEACEKINDLGKNIVVIGAGLVGVELAVGLALDGHNITIVEATDHHYPVLNWPAQGPISYIDKLENSQIFYSTKVLEIFDDCVKIQNDSGESLIKADNVIVATGFVSNTDNIIDLYGVAPQTDAIGDCRRPASVREAMEEGYFVVSNT